MDEFYGEEDVALLSDWGFNFVRLPVDYMLFESDERPGVYDEDTLSYVDRAISWCVDYDVHVNLDMHHLPGYGISDYAADPLYEPRLWSQEDLLERSEKIWRMLAERYSHIGGNLSFNVLNEPMAEMSAYKRFLERMISTVRKVDRDRLIFIDGLDLAREPVPGIQDENIVQSFHNYEPMWVTHYGADWAPGPYIYEAGCHLADETAKYPGVPPRMDRFSDVISRREDWENLVPETDRKLEALFDNIRNFFSKYNGVRADSDWLEEQIEPWLEFRKNSGTPIHCGEFGVYAPRVDRETQLNWYRDIMGIYKEHDIGWALWNLRGPFGVIEHGREEFLKEELPDGRRMDPKLLKILQNGL
ncbi:hypothetical protein AKJ65_05645 [candidate division MSBL1 archaeon SCGC-AAA259E19]|uniref:Glycoside hydrolase family 5 domain-containing protein n=1 Tax=candidate division MSBL1 archaeon SCGC-AAA259E19 TaxID=1698264 RepID=A0A133UIF0_9EURY|nr:hypothetical protein AKJ65_05645 [candidate division MSBL1 archaeon SCGC-AAA259E19]